MYGRDTNVPRDNDVSTGTRVSKCVRLKCSCIRPNISYKCISRGAERERDGNIIARKKQRDERNAKQKYVEYCATRIVARHFFNSSGGKNPRNDARVHYFGNYANNSFYRRSLSTARVTRGRGGVILITAAS